MSGQSRIEVMNFPITPYADTVANYVNQLNDEQLYSVYAQSMFQADPDVLTACLFAVVRRHPEANIQDELLFGTNLNELQNRPHVFVATINHVYAGHIYAWRPPSVSIVNLVGFRGPADILAPCMEAIYNWAAAGGIAYVRYLQPHPELASTLATWGFESVRMRRNDRAWAWLFDDASIGSTPLVGGLLFREWDVVRE